MIDTDLPNPEDMMDALRKRIFQSFPNVQKIEHKIVNTQHFVEINGQVISSDLWIAREMGVHSELDEFKSFCVEMNVNCEEGANLIYLVDQLDFKENFCYERQL